MWQHQTLPLKWVIFSVSTSDLELKLKLILMKFCKRWKKGQTGRKEDSGADLSNLGDPVCRVGEPLQEYNSDFWAMVAEEFRIGINKVQYLKGLEVQARKCKLLWDTTFQWGR